MKKLLVFAMVSAFFFSCGKKLKEENEQLSQENQELQEQLNTKEETLNDFLGSLNQIEENLKSIKDKENLITRTQLEGRPNRMDQIQNDIQAIDELLDKNRDLIARLNRDLRNSNLKLGEFERMVLRLNEQVAEKEAEIALLRTELEKMGEQVKTLTVKVEDLQDFKTFLEEETRQRDLLIEQKNRELNTVYYTMGTLKQLREMGVVSRSGGFLGIGRATNLEANFELENFTNIDKTLTRKIPLDGKKFELVSTHPNDSYEFVVEDGIHSLIIVDPNRFWDTSKHLVILVK